nr:nucleolar G-protein [Cryptomonas curvata]
MNIIFSANQIIDIILSKTQRKTPTIIHKQFSIQRIRQFYIKKLNFVNQKFNFYISAILNYFPDIDQIDQFYKDLFNILFNRNFYKIALSRLNNSKNIVYKITASYIRLLKFSETLYDCKQLKKIAIGRICTIIKKLSNALIYLEKIRKQMKSLPLIDPYRKTILLCGSGNCGKSSLMNKITKANVEVNSTFRKTKSLQLGHHNINFIRWQIIDTPSLENTQTVKYSSVEMQTINAIVHLEHTMIYVFDPSNQSKINLFRQLDVFNSILFLNKYKKKIFLLAKTDLKWEISKNRCKKSLLSYIFKISFETFQLLKISCHDEVGLIILNQRAYEVKKDKIRKYPNPNDLFLNFQIISKCHNIKNKNSISNSKLCQSLKYINFKPKYDKNLFFKNFIEIEPNKQYGLSDEKTIEKEEKVRELLYEKKYVLSKLVNLVINNRYTDFLRILPKHSLVNN